jgi:DUF3037 family protein
MNERDTKTQANHASADERTFAYRILRYTPNLVRDEWVNFGVLLFAPETGERRLRLIEDQDELNRVRRLHPQVDESLLLRLRDDLEDCFQSANGMRSYCQQVFRHAGLWERIAKRAPISQFTFPGDPLRIDYSYRRNGTRGFVHALPRVLAPKLLGNRSLLQSPMWN